MQDTVLFAVACEHLHRATAEGIKKKQITGGTMHVTETNVQHWPQIAFYYLSQRLFRPIDTVMPLILVTL